MIDPQKMLCELINTSLLGFLYFYRTTLIINGNPLADRIRFIVICKGIPFKATSWNAEWAHHTDLTRRGVSVDALISIINQTDQNFSITNNSFITANNWSSTFDNPYFHVEDIDGSAYNFDYRFQNKTYENSSDIELNYLVSRLSGYYYSDITNMIDRGISPDMSGESVFVLDGDLNSYTGFDVSACRSDVISANQKLITLSFGTVENETDNVITSANDNVMGYQSSGTHSDATLNADYANDVLNFNYPNGSIFNTYESFNGYAFDINNLGDNQSNFGKRPQSGTNHYFGLIADFIHAGGTGGEAHVYEPTLTSVAVGQHIFPAYAMGYSLVEAIYMGMPKMAYRNMVIGDPLTTIAWGKQTLTANTTLSGTNLVTGKITVPAGKTLTIASNAVINFKHTGSLEINGTLTIQPGASLNFYNGNSLVVNNVINANGNSTNKITFDFISQNSTTQNGIKINSTGTSRITYSTIKNAYYGIKVDQGVTSDQVEPFVEYCEIYDCYDGLYLYKSDYQLTMYVGSKIWHNNIHDNDNAGINLLDSEPQIAGNDIYNNPVGIRCITGSHAVFGELGDPGANNIYDNGTSVYSNYSSPYIGRDDPEMFFGGYNTIAGDTYHLHAENGGYIYAELNYWGSDSTKIVAGTGSVIDYRPYLSFESNMLASGGGETTSSLSKGSSTNNTELNLTNEKLSEAMKLFLKKEYKKAWNACESILTESSVSTAESSDLTFISTLYLLEKFNKKLDKNEVETSLNTFANATVKKDVYGYAEILLAEMDKENYLQKMDNIIASYSGSIVELAMFKKFVYFYFEEKNIENAKALYEDMIKQYPQSQLTKEAAAILGESHNEIEKKEVSPTTQVSKEFAASNYPNPFNPTTIINYSLPEKNHVTIKVFDILGREIAELVNEVKDEGIHSVNFDGSNLPSGFYIYTLSTNRNSISKKMLLLK